MVAQSFRQTSFVGRTRELADIAELLAEPNCRLLTLVGPGGIGKTRLAQAVVETYTSQNAVGVCFVYLQPIRSADLVVSTIADALGIPFYSHLDLNQQVLDYLQDKRLLLVLDNFEHLLDCADFVAEIAATAAHVKLLVTSREVLNLQEEWLFPLSGMRYPEGDEKPASSAYGYEGYEALELFVQRARRSRPDFSLENESEWVVRICQLVDGMPLGIELAAAWLKRLPCREIVNELERDLKILEHPARNVIPRHQSMRAVMAHSWELLTDEEQTVFRKLSVFRGGFRREAAEFVAGASLQTLSALMDKSLLRVDSSGRYDLQELVRQYAAEQLASSNETDHLRDAHSRYYLNFVAAREADIKGRRQRNALQEIEADFENVRSAWLRAVERKMDTAINATVSAFAHFCDMTSRHWHFDELLGQAVDVFGSDFGEQEGLLWARLTAYQLWISYGGPQTQDASALTRVQKCLEIAHKFHDESLIAFSLYVQGVAYADLGELLQANSSHEESSRYSQKLNDPFLSAEQVTRIGLNLACNEPYPLTKAHEWLQRSVQMHVQIGDIHGAGFSLGLLAMFFSHMNNHIEAERLITEAMALFREINCRKGIALCSWMSAWFAINTGDFEKAEHLTEVNWKIESELKYPTVVAFLLSGNLAVFKGDYLKGQEFFERARSLNFDNHPPDAMAIMAFGLGEFERCRAYLGQLINEFLSTLRPEGNLFLGVAALLLAQDGYKERSVEVLGLTFHHPASYTGLLGNWPLLSTLRANLEAEMGGAAYHAAWERGKSLDLLSTARALLLELNIPHMNEPTASFQPLPDALSEREREILNFIAAGLSNREIADKLCLALSTVKWYINEIYSKLHVISRTQAAARAREMNLIS